MPRFFQPKHFTDSYRQRRAKAIQQGVTTLHRVALKELKTKSELTGDNESMAEMTMPRSS